jgi:hypothetical protein
MILNQPTKAEFEKVAIENLTQAFHLLFEVYDKYDQYDDEVVRSEVSMEDMWVHHNGTLRTSLILVHQAIEGLMKGSICRTSPLLLIDKPRRDWPSLPEAEDKDFDALYTIGGESLLTTFCAVNPVVSITAELIRFIEDIRQKRNQAIHGTNVVGISAPYLLQRILTTFTIWFGPDVWHKELKKNLIENPLFGYYDADVEEVISYKYLDFVEDLIGKTELGKHISFPIKGRSYFCPACKNAMSSDYGELESKWAFLNPNLPTSKNVSCINCHANFAVVRTNCDSEKCRGNVVFPDPTYPESILCLTCYKEQE